MRSANAPAFPRVEAAKHFKTGFKTVQIDGVAWRVFATYGAERDVQVYVGEQLKSRDSILWAVLRSTLWPIALALPLLALALWWAVSSSASWPATARSASAAMASRTRSKRSSSAADASI